MAAIADAPTLADPDDAPVPHVTHAPETGCAYPAPTTPEPDFVTLAGQLIDSCAEATDGCFPSEPDGVRKHGHPMWLRRLGVISGRSRAGPRAGTGAPYFCSARQHIPEILPQPPVMFDAETPITIAGGTPSDANVTVTSG